ncbi:prevent-host-death family protein [Dyadobacter jiangsuensis]|uniref:prevent-host-death family protein n=1 Tax=Dyadobacter fermentans TaxID=94254 RepID=UPI001CBE4DA9|nr:prevent-host-death family protein [Dyadobacter fermentans]MBZ1360748.1 prevent-host-death family protein [Dyadobacter fermentans]
MNLHAQIIKENGEAKFAVLPIEIYDALRTVLSEFDSFEDFSDCLMAMNTKAETKTWHSLDDVKLQLQIE